MAIRMIVALLLVFPFCIMGQRYPDFFVNQDFKNFGLMHHSGNPNSLVRPYGAPYNNQNTERQNPYGITEKPFLDPYQFKDLYDELDLLDDRITKSNKWEEYKAFAAQLREKAAENPNNDWHDDLRKILEWSRKLEKAPRPDQTRPMSLTNVESRPVINPSPGMSAYWGENEKEKKIPSESRLPTPPPGIPRILSGYQLKELALKKINSLRTMDGANALITNLREVKYDTHNPLPSINLQSTSLEPPKPNNQKQNNNILPQYWHDDLRKILEWSRKLEKAPRPDQTRPMSLTNVESRPVINPSPGMSAYWGENEKEKKIPSESRLPTPPPGIPRILSGYQLKELALKKINSLRTMDGANALITNLREVKYDTHNPLPSINLQSTSLEPPKPNNQKQNNNILPQYDDFGSPIKWVPVTSNETRDGLAKITDPSSGRNREYTINGTIFVPVIDYSMERLGFTTTTTSAPVHTTDAAVLHTVTRNIDIKDAQQNDWLVFETVMGGRDDETECYGEGCQARCKKQGCDTSCSGDTCAAGCVASSCNSFCKGPGCFAMCVGEGCSAKCEGMSCDARCRGEGCETSCRRFSCTYTTNGKSSVGGGMWLEHYPQYDHANIKANY